MIPRHPGENRNQPSGAALGFAASPAPTMPSQVRTAAMLMYAGAVLGAIGPLYYGLATSPSTAPRIWHVGNPTSGAYAAGFVLGGVLFAAIVAALWLWMAWAVRRGRNWARIVSVVFFGLGALRLLTGLTSNPASIVTLTWALSWLAGLGAIILLFQRPASAFFASGARSPNPPGYPYGYGNQTPGNPSQYGKGAESWWRDQGP